MEVLRMNPSADKTSETLNRLRFKVTSRRARCLCWLPWRWRMRDSHGDSSESVLSKHGPPPESGTTDNDTHRGKRSKTTQTQTHTINSRETNGFEFSTAPASCTPCTLSCPYFYLYMSAVTCPVQEDHVILLPSS